MRRAVAVLLVLLAVLAIPTLRAAGQGPVNALVLGPSAVAPVTTHAYTIIVTGGPGEADGTFQISYVLEGENLAGANPTVPFTLTRDDGRFSVNVTAPQAEGRVQLFVRATSSLGDRNETTETRFPIDVAQPVEFRATLRNNGAAEAVNVTALFYVDGRLVGNATVPRIGAGGSAEVNLTYIPIGLAAGRHTIEIRADLDGDGLISPERGELLASDFFYRTERSNLPAILGTVTVVILIVLGFVLLAIRRQRRQG